MSKRRNNRNREPYRSKKTYETVQPQTYELTPRQEGVVEKFGVTMTAIADNYPDLFWGELNDEQVPTMPERWV